MNKEVLWRIVTDQNPALLGDGKQIIRLRIRGVRKMFDLAWDEGAKASYEDIAENIESCDNMPGFMKGFFGK